MTLKFTNHINSVDELTVSGVELGKGCTPLLALVNISLSLRKL